jgi:hypothetical protein
VFSLLAVFVFRKVVSGKPLSKLFCVYLPLENLVNGKHFLVKEKFGLVFRKVFSLLAVFVFQKVVSRKPLSKLFCVCLPLENLVNEKHFPVNGNTFRSTENTFQSKKNLVWFPGKCFPFWLCLFSRKWFPENHFPNFSVFVCH